MDFAAKLCLRTEEYFIVNPPGANDDKLADLVYAELASYGIHTKDQIKQFEERHIQDKRPLERIWARDFKKFERSITTRANQSEDYCLPVSSPKPILRQRSLDFGCICRTSVAFRYGAILFTALSHMWRQIDFVQPILFEEKMAFTICNIFYNGFSQFLDNRIKIPLLKWPEILSTATNISYGRAASRFSTRTTLCKSCTNTRRQDPAYMTEVQPGIYRCNRCRGTKSLRRKLSIRNIKNRRYEALIRCFYYQLFEPGEKLYQGFISLLDDMKADSGIRCLLTTEFDKQEKESDSRSFHRHNYYYMQHHLPNGKKKACRLDDGKMLQVEITDEIYSERVHELIGICTFVAGLAESDEVDFNANPATMELKRYLVQRVKILVNECYERLLELNYPDDFALQKVTADLLRL
jgi:hypothetical protein